MSNLLQPWLAAAAVRYSGDHGDLLGSLLGGKNAQLIEICGSTKRRREGDTGLGGRATYDSGTWCRFSDKQTTLYAWINNKTIVDFEWQNAQEARFSEQLYSILEITQYRWTYEVPYLTEPGTGVKLDNTPPQVCLHIDRLAYKAEGDKIFPPSSGELCGLENPGKLLEKEDREELKRWLDSLDEKYHGEETSNPKAKPFDASVLSETDRAGDTVVETWGKVASWGINSASHAASASIAPVFPPAPPAAIVAIKKEAEVEEPSRSRRRSPTSPALATQAVLTRTGTSTAASPTANRSSPGFDPTPSLPAPVNASFGSLPPPAAQHRPKVSYEPIIGSSGETVDNVPIIVRSQCTGQPVSHQPQKETQQTDEMLYEEGAEEWSSSIVREKSGEPEGRIDTDVDESQFRRPRTRSRSAFSVGQSRLEEDDEVAKKHPKIEVVSPVRHSTSSVTTGQDPPHVAARTGSPSAAKEPTIVSVKQSASRRSTPRQPTPRQPTPRQPTPVAPAAKIRRVNPTVLSPLIEIPPATTTSELRKISESILSPAGARNNANILRLLQQVDICRDSVVQSARTTYSEIKPSPRPPYALLESFYNAVEVKLRSQDLFSRLSFFWRRVLIESRPENEATIHQLLDKISQRTDLADLDDIVKHREFSKDELSLFHHFWRKDRLFDRSGKSAGSMEWRTTMVGEVSVETELVAATRAWVDEVLAAVEEAERVTLELKHWLSVVVVPPSVVSLGKQAISTPAPRKIIISAPSPVTSKTQSIVPVTHDEETANSSRPTKSTSVHHDSQSLALPVAAPPRRSLRSASPATLLVPPTTAARTKSSALPEVEDFPASQMVERLPRAPAASDRSATARMHRRLAAAAQKNSERLSEISSVVEESSNIASSPPHSSA